MHSLFFSRNFCYTLFYSVLPLNAGFVTIMNAAMRRRGSCLIAKPLRPGASQHPHSIVSLAPLKPRSTTIHNTIGSPRLHPLLSKSQPCLRQVSSAQKARDLNQKGIDQEMSAFDAAIADDKSKQLRAPWHREGADIPPVKRQRSAGAMTKGRPCCANPSSISILTIFQGNSSLLLRDSLSLSFLW